MTAVSAKWTSEAIGFLRRDLLQAAPRSVLSRISTRPRSSREKSSSGSRSRVEEVNFLRLRKSKMPDDEPSSSSAHAPPHEGRARGRKFSEVLRSIADDPNRERVSVGDLLAAMGDRAFGALMLVFALPNLIPTPPGTSSVLGMPLVLLAAQLMLGQRPWLPRLIADRSMLRSDFAALIVRAGPWLAKAEKLVKPRLMIFVYPPGARRRLGDRWRGDVCRLDNHRRRGDVRPNQGRDLRFHEYFQLKARRSGRGN
jgi:Exopolysaccharide synthesis, ExoD